MHHRTRTTGIVMQREDTGENHRLVTLLSREQGKLKVLAPGARRSRRRFGGCLELFSLIEVQVLERGSGKLPTLEEALLLDAHEPIKADLVAIGHAVYALELTASLLGEGDVVPDMFDLLSSALAELDRGPLDAAGIRRFEFQVLAVAGLAPHLDACLRCRATEAGMWGFDVSQGGILCGSCQGSGHQSSLLPLDPTTLHLLRCLQQGANPKADPEAVNAAREILSRIILDHVGHPLRSRDFLRMLGRKTS